MSGELKSLKALFSLTQRTIEPRQSPRLKSSAVSFQRIDQGV